MATSVGTVLIAKETAYTSVQTYYKATLDSIKKAEDVLSFGVRIDIVLGSSTALAEGSSRQRTAFVYDANGTLIGSKLIKDANTSWVSGKTYTHVVDCQANVGADTGMLAGCYIRILYSETSEYGGSTQSCYWNGKTNSSGNVGNTFSIEHDASYLDAVKIHDGSAYQDYSVYISDGTSYSQYSPYIHDGTDWKRLQ